MAEFGLSVALLTPFDQSGAIDAARLAAHARRVIAGGAVSVTLFGTTGEGASVALDERPAAIDALRRGGLAPDQLILGVFATATGDALVQIGQGLDRGVRDVLLAPPFFFADPSDQGLFDWHAKVLAGTPDKTRFILYNIPQLTGVTISTGLIGRLAAAFPGRLCAVKDSSGSWDAAAGYLRAGHVPVLVGDERLLARAVREGAAGAISGMANLHPARMHHLIDTGQDDARLSAEVDCVLTLPVVPAIKALQARDTGDAAWLNLRPPLAQISADARRKLCDKVDAARAG